MAGASGAGADGSGGGTRLGGMAALGVGMAVRCCAVRWSLEQDRACKRYTWQRQKRVRAPRAVAVELDQA